MSAISSSTKRRRLNHACTRCRTRKVRCDVSYPKCSNCRQAGVECVTIDPRRDNAPVHRGFSGQTEDRVTEPHTTPTCSRSHSIHYSELDAGDAIQSVEADQRQSQVVTQLPALPRFRNGDNRSALTQWLDLAFVRLRIPMKLTSHYRQPQPFSANVFDDDLTGLMTSLLDTDGDDCAKRYCETVNQVFPLFSDDEVLKIVRDLFVSRGSLGQSRGLDVVAAVLIMGSARVSFCGIDDELARNCIRYALTQVGRVLSANGLLSVQLCTLLALNLRAQADSNAAYSIISLGLSIAQNLGLHRAKTSAESGAVRSVHSRIWWSLYCTEKILCLESERLSFLRDSECSQTIMSITNDAERDIDQVWKAQIELCQLQHHVVERLKHLLHNEEQPSPNIDQIVRDKLQAAGELDAELLAFAHRQPFNLNASDFSSFDPRLIPGISFLAIQYQQTIFTINRNALLLHDRLVTEEVNRWFSDAKWRFRICHGAKICAEVARTLISITNSIYEQDNASILHTEHALLVAIFAIAIIILRGLTPGLIGSDLELQSRAVEIITRRQSRSDSDISAYHTVFLRELQDRISKHVTHKQSQSTARSQTEIGQSQFQLQPINSQRTLDHDAPAPGVSGAAVDTVYQHDSPDLFDINLFDVPFDFDLVDWSMLTSTYDLPS